VDGGTVKDSLPFLLFRSLRPKQWTKNVAIFAALVFSQRFFEPTFFLETLLAFFLFCFISGSVYILNDVVDLEQDKKHPQKSKRPLASGKLSPSAAVTVGAIIMVVSVTVSYRLSIPFCIVATSYLILQVVYSFYLKHLVILDVFCVAAGFVLRVVGGAEVIHVPISSWLLICTILLSLFLAMSKRRHELILLEDNAVHHRKILYEYSPYFLDQMISVVTSSTVIAYALYTMSEETVKKFHTDNLKFTIPFVIYGIFRYLYLIHQKNEGGNPEMVLLTDKPLIINILLYGLVVGFILYF
jgi:4-hydroxybenzoate polyprenyltransferase